MLGSLGVADVQRIQHEAIELRVVLYKHTILVARCLE